MKGILLESRYFLICFVVGWFGFGLEPAGWLPCSRAGCAFKSRGAFVQGVREGSGSAPQEPAGKGWCSPARSFN